MFIKEHSVLYLHPGKTGGSSVESMLAEAYKLKDFKMFKPHPLVAKKYVYWLHQGRFVQHADFEHTISLIEEFHGDDAYDINYIFATVRNPYTRAFSAYKYQGIDKKMAFEEFILNKIEERSTRPCDHFLPQHHYTHMDNQLVLDRLVHLENFDTGMANVAIDLGIKFDYKHLNKRPSDKPHYTSEMKAVMQRIYKKDFEFYGYPTDY